MPRTADFLWWLWLEKGSRNVRITCSFSPLNSPSVLLLPQRARLSWRTQQLLRGRNGPLSSCGRHPAPDGIRSSKLCLHSHKALSWLREKSWCIPHCFKMIVSSFHPCTHFVINLSADEMKHHSDYKCIFKTSFLSIISQWLDKENFWFTICF